MRALWSDRPNCSHSVSQKVKRIRRLSLIYYCRQGKPQVPQTTGFRNTREKNDRDEINNSGHTWGSPKASHIKASLSLSTVGSPDWFQEWLRIKAHRFSQSLSQPYSETPWLKPVIRIFRIFRVFVSAFSAFSAFSFCGISSDPCFPAQRTLPY